MREITLCEGTIREFYFIWTRGALNEIEYTIMDFRAEVVSRYMLLENLPQDTSLRCLATGRSRFALGEVTADVLSCVALLFLKDIQANSPDLLISSFITRLCVI